MDAISLPFVMPKGPQDDVVYIIYETFYCYIPLSDEGPSKIGGGDGNAVRAYSEWLNNNKRIRGTGLSSELLSALKSSKAVVQHPDTMAALNHFLSESKFVLERHLLWTGDDTTVTDMPMMNLLPDKTRDFLTLVYHRTVPPDASGITMDANIFTLMSAQGDTTTALQITKIPSQEIVSLINQAIKGIDTNILRPLPTDKSLYAMVTVILSHNFDNIGGNKQET